MFLEQIFKGASTPVRWLRYCSQKILELALFLSVTVQFYLQSSVNDTCNGYLGHPFKNKPHRDGERFPSPACKHRRVGVESDVVASILMLERRYSYVMEKLLV